MCRLWYSLESNKLTDEQDALRVKGMKKRTKEDKWSTTSGQLLQDHSRWDYVLGVV